MSDPDEDEDRCPRCGDGDVPLGYWKCPVCDAEWYDEDDDEPFPLPPEPSQ